MEMEHVTTVLKLRYGLKGQLRTSWKKKVTHTQVQYLNNNLLGMFGGIDMSLRYQSESRYYVFIVPVVLTVAVIVGGLTARKVLVVPQTFAQ